MQRYSDATWATYICLCRHTKWWKGTPSTPRIISSWRYKKFIHGLNHLQYSNPTLVALIRTLQPKSCATLLDELYLSLPMQNRTRYIHNRVAHTMCKTLMFIHSLLVWLSQSTLRCNHIKDTWSRRHEKPNATKHTTIPSWNNQTVKFCSFFFVLSHLSCLLGTGVSCDPTPGSAATLPVPGVSCDPTHQNSMERSTFSTHTRGQLRPYLTSA